MFTMVGAVALNTVTSNVHTLVLPFPSSARTVTVVVPSAKLEPLAGVAVMVTLPEHGSSAEVENVTFALFEEVQTVVLAGQVMDGAVVSTTLTVRLAVPVCPLPSFAE